MKHTLKKNKYNIRQSLLSVGLSPKGGNYDRCYRLIDKNLIKWKEKK